MCSGTSNVGDSLPGLKGSRPGSLTMRKIMVNQSISVLTQKCMQGPVVSIIFGVSVCSAVLCAAPAYLLCFPTLMSSARPLRPMAVVQWCKLRSGLAGKGQQGKTSKLFPNKTVCLHGALLPSRMLAPSECCSALMARDRSSVISYQV